MDFNGFQSSFSFRYGSREMRALWSEKRRLSLQRKVWIAVASAMRQAGLVSAKQLEDLQRHVDELDIERVQQIERDVTQHDVMAAVHHFAEVAPIGAPIIHLGMTSEDVNSNVDILRLRAALELIIAQLIELLEAFVGRIDQHADLVCCGWTHWQVAQPTTVGYRLAGYAQDLLTDLEQLQALRTRLLPKGLKGATGTRASFVQLLENKQGWTAERLEQSFLQELGLPGAYTITGQTYPRKVDLLVLQALAGTAQSLHRFAQDFRVLQSTPFSEWEEARSAKQVGSSAMPHKRNPINCENICSLSRLVESLVHTAWENAALTGLERTLDDSGNRREFLPAAFLATEECLRRAVRVVRGMVLNEAAICRNIERYGPFLGLEPLMMWLVGKRGQDRQVMHELCRQASSEAWTQTVHAGQSNQLLHLLTERFIGIASQSEIEEQLARAATHVGDAPARARQFANAVRAAIAAERATSPQP